MEEKDQHNSGVAWHYTTGEKYMAIRGSGVLRTTVVGVSYPEKPVVWFSTHATFEPTAIKGIIERGVRRAATIEEMRTIAGGLFRLSLDIAKLVPWPELASKANISRNVARRLESAGLACGADPLQWYGSLNNIEIGALNVECMDDEGRWVSQ